MCAYVGNWVCLCSCVYRSVMYVCVGGGGGRGGRDLPNTVVTSFTKHVSDATYPTLH